MNSDDVEIGVRGLMPVSSGVAAFLGTAAKVFVIHVDSSTGKAMHMAMQGRSHPRPMTHDLVTQLLMGFDIRLERVLIDKREEDTFFAKLFLCKTLPDGGREVLVLDARPSDCIVLAIQARRPVYITRDVLEGVEDMSDLLERFRSEDK